MNFKVTYMIISQEIIRNNHLEDEVIQDAQH